VQTVHTLVGTRYNVIVICCTTVGGGQPAGSERYLAFEGFLRPVSWINRYEAGALNLASPEVKISKAENEDTNSALDVKLYELRETNMMVEEMMLMANIAVANHIHKAFPSCAILRRHEPPTPAMFEPLLVVRTISIGVA
jgi:exoribonuclease R